MKTPWFHILRRNNVSRKLAWGIRIAAIILGVLVCALFTLLTAGVGFGEFVSSLFKGSFGSSRRFWVFAQGTAILLCISLAVTPAFRMRFWNTGAEGQTLIGAMACATVMLFLGDKLPSFLVVIVALLASVLAGMIWGVIPAVFKAKWHTNETLFTLMMNYVAIQLVNYLVYIWAVPKGSGQIGIINQSTQSGWLPNLFGQKYLLNIIIVLVVLVFSFIYVNYTKQGYENNVVGESENTARYIGINVKKVIIRTMLLSGAICGIAGFLIVSGTDHTVRSDSVGGQGFTAIMVSWLAKFDPIMMVLTAALIIFLKEGALQISSQYMLATAFADIIVGIVIFFIIGCEFFINYRFIFNKKDKEVRA